jgi:hypothetical protein
MVPAAEMKKQLGAQKKKHDEIIAQLQNQLSNLVSICACTYICMYVYMYVCMYVFIPVYSLCNFLYFFSFSSHTYIDKVLLLYVCMYVCRRRLSYSSSTHWPTATGPWRRKIPVGQVTPPYILLAWVRALPFSLLLLISNRCKKKFKISEMEDSHFVRKWKQWWRTSSVCMSCCPTTL